VDVFPIQAITAVLYCCAGIVGIHLFLSGHDQLSFLLTLSITQIWRFLSEFLRADFRGSLKISIYQIMAFLTVPYGFLISTLSTAGQAPPADLANGFAVLWNPLLLILLQLVWIIIFWFSGRSHTTGSILKLHVNQHKI
jgi:hypothetical protein